MNEGGGSLTVIDSSFRNNRATYNGGAIENEPNSSSATVTGCLFVGNSTQIDTGGAIGEYGPATLSIYDSTFTQNRAASNGGAIDGRNDFGTPVVSVTSSTITGNTARRGGGIIVAGELTLQNSIVSGNTATNPNDPGIDVYYTIASDNGHNLLGTTVQASNPTDVFSDKPQLSSLGYFGGPTQTMTPLPGSPAIGAGATDGPDQRGFAPTNDIGAFQTQPSPLVVNTSGDATSGAEPRGELSLRDAINLANILSPAGGPSTITFDPSLTGGTITLAGVELPLITANMTITGPGPSQLAISGNNQSRVFHISGGVNVTIQGLTIENGNAQDGSGGGLFIDGNFDNGTLTGDVFQDNQAPNGNGGAIEAAGPSYAGTLTIGVSTFSSNTAAGNGGAIDSPGVTLNVSGSTFDRNKADSTSSYGGGGGALSIGTGTVTIDDSTLSNNLAPFANGGAVNCEFGVALTINNSTIQSNQSGFSGGGIDARNGFLALTDSTVSGNTARVRGGGIYNNGPATISNSTIYGNVATGSDYSSGGGIENFGGLTLTDSTVSGNMAGVAGGVANEGELSPSNSIVAGNNSPSSPDIGGKGGIDDYGYNVIGVGDGTVFVNSQNHDLVGTAANPLNPLLGPLQNNGGPVPTMALLPNSPAIDTGSLVQGTTTDARGVNRPQGTAPDIGAYEAPAFSESILSGNGQQTTDGTAFALPLKVRVLEGGLPVAGEAVTFAVSSGSATFPGGVIMVTVLTDASGIAASPTLTAGAISGPVTVVASINHATTQTDFTSTENTPQIFAQGNSNVFTGAAFKGSGSFNDLAPGVSLTVDYGDGSAVQSLSFDPTNNQFTFSHVFTQAGFYVVTVTLTDGVGNTTTTELFVTVAIPPALSVSGNTSLNVGDVFTGSGSFIDNALANFQSDGGAPSPSNVSLTVNYGDGSAVQSLSFDTADQFTFQHTFTQDGTFQVTVSLNDGLGGMATAILPVNVELPGVPPPIVVQVPPGQTETLSISGQTVSGSGKSQKVFSASLTITVSQPAGSALPLEIIAAVVPRKTDAALPTSSFLLDSGIEVTAFDIRVLNATSATNAEIVFTYGGTAIAEPTLMYFDKATNSQEEFYLDGETVDPINHVIEGGLDYGSTPSIGELEGTVFTISVPLVAPSEVNSADVSTNIVYAPPAEPASTAGDETGSGTPASSSATAHPAATAAMQGLAAAGAGDLDTRSGAGSDGGPLSELPPVAPPQLGPGTAAVAPATVGMSSPELPGPAGSVEPGAQELEPEIGEQESGVRSQESGVRSQESGVRSQESGVGNQEVRVERQESEVGSQPAMELGLSVTHFTLDEEALALRDAAFATLVHKKKVSNAGMFLVLAATGGCWGDASRRGGIEPVTGPIVRASSVSGWEVGKCFASRFTMHASGNNWSMRAVPSSLAGVQSATTCPGARSRTLTCRRTTCGWRRCPTGRFGSRT